MQANQKFRNYQLVRLLGSGQFGEIWEARDLKHSWPRAIKTLRTTHASNANLRARFLLEGHATGLVGHPGVVQVFEVGEATEEDGGCLYIIMELLEGESLLQRMDSGTVTPGPLLRLLVQVARAMHAAHSKGVIHRDLKPANLMIVADPDVPGGERAKVVDFGLAKIPGDRYPDLVTRIDTYLQTAVDKVVMGTPQYMAPEQCRARRDIDGKADVYALGSILYEALGGQPLFHGPVPAVLAKQMSDEPAPLRARAPQVKPAVAALVHAMLAKDPQRRPSMMKVAAVLERLIDDHQQAEPATHLLPLQQVLSPTRPPSPTLVQRLTAALRLRAR